MLQKHGAKISPRDLDDTTGIPWNIPVANKSPSSLVSDLGMGRNLGAMEGIANSAALCTGSAVEDRGQGQGEKKNTPIRVEHMKSILEGIPVSDKEIFSSRTTLSMSRQCHAKAAPCQDRNMRRQ